MNEKEKILTELEELSKVRYDESYFTDLIPRARQRMEDRRFRKLRVAVLAPALCSLILCFVIAGNLRVGNLGPVSKNEIAVSAKPEKNEAVSLLPPAKEKARILNLQSHRVISKQKAVDNEPDNREYSKEEYSYDEYQVQSALAAESYYNTSSGGMSDCITESINDGVYEDSDLNEAVSYVYDRIGASK